MCTPIKASWPVPGTPRAQTRLRSPANAFRNTYVSTAKNNRRAVPVADSSEGSNRNVCASLIYPLGRPAENIPIAQEMTGLTYGLTWAMPLSGEYGNPKTSTKTVLGVIPGASWFIPADSYQAAEKLRFDDNADTDAYIGIGSAPPDILSIQQLGGTDIYGNPIFQKEELKFNTINVGGFVFHYMSQRTSCNASSAGGPWSDSYQTTTNTNAFVSIIY